MTFFFLVGVGVGGRWGRKNETSDLGWVRQHPIFTQARERERERVRKWHRVQSNPVTDRDEIPVTQPATVACEMEAQLEYVVTYTFLARVLAPICMLAVGAC